MQRLEDLYSELKRRKVFKVASGYLVAAWGLSMGAEALLPVFGAPDWAVRAFVIIGRATSGIGMEGLIEHR